MTALEENEKLSCEQFGQDIARRFLVGEGYQILEKNWSCNAGSIDMIAGNDEALVFVTILATTEPGSGLPEYQITDEDRKRNEAIALAFVFENNLVSGKVRFDYLTICGDGKSRAFLKHHVNALGAD